MYTCLHAPTQLHNADADAADMPHADTAEADTCWSIPTSVGHANAIFISVLDQFETVSGQKWANLLDL